MIYVENKDLVIPGEVLADDDYYSGRGTFKENGKICSSLMGLVSLRNKKRSRFVSWPFFVSLPELT